MPAEGNFQMDLDFSGPEAGHTAWRDQRAEALRRLGSRLGLPLGHRVTLELNEGIVLTGLLSLAEERLLIDEERNLDLELRLGRCTFRVRDIRACCRTD